MKERKKRQEDNKQTDEQTNNKHKQENKQKTHRPKAHFLRKDGGVPSGLNTG